MNDVVGNIFYFGSPKDGFKVYPDVGAVSNVFSGYYSNTETDWILIAKKSDEITRYTYVKYGLLTSAVDGRTGSCFGIAIDFVNHYFTDLKVFRTQIVEGVLGAILDDRQVLEIQTTSGKVAFKSYDLYDVGPYLDEMSKKIREVIADTKYSNYIRPSYEIPNAGDTLVYGLHPDSSPSAVSECFRTYGAIKLSPNLPIETKSLAEKQEEHRNNLQEEVDKLNRQLHQKDEEISGLKQRHDELGELIKPLFSRFSDTAVSNESNQYIGERQSRSRTYEPYPTPSKAASYKPPQKLNDTKIVIIAAAAIVLVALFAFGLKYALSEDEKPAVNYNANTSQLLSQQKTKTPPPTDPLLIKLDNGKRKGFLKESAFLERNEGTAVSSEADFKEVLTSYLFASSPQTQDIYKGNKDDLWNKIMELNPTSRRRITDYIRAKAPFKIENNGDQQSILKDLVIFAQSPQ